MNKNGALRCCFFVNVLNGACMRDNGADFEKNAPIFCGYDRI